jgi:hypothetical protein
LDTANGGSLQAKRYYDNAGLPTPILRPDRSFTPTHATKRRSKPSAATASIKPQQVRTRGEIPIAPAAPPPHTSPDFVPWRFSAAGHKSAWMGRNPGGQKPAQKRHSDCPPYDFVSTKIVVQTDLVFLLLVELEIVLMFDHLTRAVDVQPG